MQTWAEPGRPVADPAASLTVDLSLVQTLEFCAGPNRQQPVDQRFPDDGWRDNQGLHRSGNTNPATSMATQHYHDGNSNDNPNCHRHNISPNDTAEHRQNLGAANLWNQSSNDVHPVGAAVVLTTHHNDLWMTTSTLVSILCSFPRAGDDNLGPLALASIGVPTVAADNADHLDGMTNQHCPKKGAADACSLDHRDGCCCPSAGGGHHFPDLLTDDSSNVLGRTIGTLCQLTDH